MIGYEYDYSPWKKQTLSNYGVFKDLHVPLLVFQASTLKYVNKKYKITRDEFTVLAAGYMIQKRNFMLQFSNPDLKDTSPGISHNVLYKCINSLLAKGFIVLKEPRKTKRRFLVSQKGMDCIQAYIQYYNQVVKNYENLSLSRRMKSKADAIA